MDPASTPSTRPPPSGNVTDVATSEDSGPSSSQKEAAILSSIPDLPQLTSGGRPADHGADILRLCAGQARLALTSPAVQKRIFTSGGLRGGRGGFRPGYGSPAREDPRFEYLGSPDEEFHVREARPAGARGSPVMNLPVMESASDDALDEAREFASDVRKARASAPRSADFAAQIEDLQNRVQIMTEVTERSLHQSETLQRTPERKSAADDRAINSSAASSVSSKGRG